MYLSNPVEAINSPISRWCSSQFFMVIWLVYHEEQFDKHKGWLDKEQIGECLLIIKIAVVGIVVLAVIAVALLPSPGSFSSATETVPDPVYTNVTVGAGKHHGKHKQDVQRGRVDKQRH
jgi:hypothetical protein